MQGKLTIQHVKVDQLAPNKFNPNVVSSENEQKIDASLRRFGMFKPILCREVNGQLEILGGQHRWESAKRLGYGEVPVVNLGHVDDKKAMELCLVDNSSYGADDTLKLAEILESLGDVEDLLSFMPYSEAEISTIFSSVDIDLDDLDLPDDHEPKAPPAKAIQTHTIIRFKVPIEDQEMIIKKIEKVQKIQRFTEEDALANAGNALVHILNEVEV